MQVTIMANQYIGQRGYTGAVLKLPAGKAGIADALACAHTPSEKEIALKWFEDWPQFLDNVLEACGEKKLEDVVRQINRCFSLQIKTDILMLNAA